MTIVQLIIIPSSVFCAFPGGLWQSQAFPCWHPKAPCTYLRFYQNTDHIMLCVSLIMLLLVCEPLEWKRQCLVHLHFLVA